MDIDGNKVYLELLKDGQVIDSQVIVAANEVDDTFVYSRPGTLQKIMVHFKNVFRGADQNIVTADIVQQTSEIHPYPILRNDSHSRTVSTSTALKLDEGYDLAIRSVDIDGNKALIDLLKDGQVIDSQVIIAANEVDDTFVYSRPGTMQKIMVHFKNMFRRADQSLVSIDRIEQTSEIYPHSILLNDSSYRTFTSGTPSMLEEGYELAVQSVDIDGNKAYVELFKDGDMVDSRIVIAAKEGDGTYNYVNPETGQELAIHFKNAFRGADGN